MGKRLILAFTIGLTAIAASGKDTHSSASLQLLLDSALPDDKPIVLTRGSDFTEKVGTVIFISRKQGMEKMVNLAREDQPELAMLFLPKWDAWITETQVRTADEARIDLRFIFAAIASGTDVELWHSHNNVGRELSNSEEIRKRSLSWTMPSSQDMVQLYEFESETGDKVKICGVIANIYGITTYWTDDSLWGASRPANIGYALQGEGYRLNYKAGEVSPATLQEFASTYKGYVRLRFDPF